MWALCFYPVWFWRFGLDVGRKNKALYTGLSVQGLHTWGEDWVNGHFENLLDVEIAAQVEICRQSGYQLVLMTGAPECLARPIAQHLRMDDCIATVLAERGGIYRAAPPLRHPLGKDKLRLAQAWCDERRISLNQCAAYGDSHQDRYLLAAVGKAVAVNPDRRMVRLASNQRWQVLRGKAISHKL